MAQPPRARKIPYEHHLHGDVRSDEYYWLKERDNPEVIRYLEAENRYYQAMMQPLESFTEELYEEMRSHVMNDEMEVPAQDGPYFYYERMVADQEYPIYARKRAQSREELGPCPEEIILDVNALATKEEFLSVSLRRISPDHRFLAFLENHDGTDRYTLRIKDLQTHEFLSDTVSNVFIEQSVEWDGSGQFVYYVTVDDTQRPYRLWRHQLGFSVSEDILMYEESDNTYTLSLTKSLDGRYLFIGSKNKATSEVRFLESYKPEQPVRVFWPRETGVLYSIEHRDNEFLILTNKKKRNFELLSCSDQEFSPSACKPLVPYDDNKYLSQLYPFKDGLLIQGRQDGLTQIWIFDQEQLDPLPWPETLYYVHLGPNLSASPDEVLLHYESFLTPPRTYGLNLAKRSIRILRQQAVPGGYDPMDYEQTRTWATAEDGTQIPVSMVYSRKILNRNGPHPLILYGYGSYGFSMEPFFASSRLPVLDRGVVMATAHIRGGSERGRWWYDQGKLMNKRNTFSDFISVARYLIDQGWTEPHKLAARGRSAGGLLMGAILNMAPELFQVVAPGVPFVDVVTTMLDSSIPLTTLEWDEWGDPHRPEPYHYMKSYSPYDNVESKPYPHIYLYAGLNDPRVGYFEPAKFAARMRDRKTDDHVLVLKTHMGAGHMGSSGRYAHLRELAEEYAFILDKLEVIRSSSGNRV